MRGLLLVILGACSVAIGCRRADLVEAELRTRERELRETREELDRSQFYNHALQSEIGDLRKGGPPGCTVAQSPLTPERASQVYTLKEIVLGRQTGGYDNDNVPGDEALQVVLEPRDPDAQAIKAPGRLIVTALQVSPEGLKMPLSTWEIAPDQLRRTWRNGLLSTGYYVVLPWKSWPTTPRLRVIAQFTLADGRVFEADKDVTIRLLPNLKGLPPGTADHPFLELELAPPPREVIRSESRGQTTSTINSMSAWRKAVPSTVQGVRNP